MPSSSGPQDNSPQARPLEQREALTAGDVRVDKERLDGQGSRRLEGRYQGIIEAAVAEMADAAIPIRGRGLVFACDIISHMMSTFENDVSRTRGMPGRKRCFVGSPGEACRYDLANGKAKTLLIQGVIFDYGNVLSATRDTQPRAAWEHKLGLSTGELGHRVHNDHSWVAAQCGRMSVEAYWQGIGHELHLTSDDLEQLRTDFYRGDIRNDALVVRIDAMRQAGFRLGILSNFSRELWMLLERQHLRHRFDAIAVSADIGVMKPAPAAYHAILDMLSLPPEACLFIDDLPDNIAAAQALGLHGIVFRDSPSCLAEIDRRLASSPPS